MKFNPEAIKNFLVAAVLPLVVGAISAKLVSVGVLNVFGVSASQVTNELTLLGTFGIGAGVTWLFAHFHLSGAYTPGAKQLKAGVELLSTVGGDVERTSGVVRESAK